MQKQEEFDEFGESELQLFQSNVYNPVPILMSSLYRLSRIRSFLGSGNSLGDYENTLLDFEIQLSFDIEEDHNNKIKDKKTGEMIPSTKEILIDLIKKHNEDIKKNKIDKKELSGQEQGLGDKLYLKYLDNKYRVLKKLVDKRYRGKQYAD